MHRLIIRMVAVAALFQFVAAERVLSQACASATDSIALYLRHRVRRLSASTDPTKSYERRDLKLASVDSTTIVAITQAQTCQKALAAYNSTLTGVSPLPTKIYLVKVGTAFVAMYPINTDHLWPAAVVDSKFKILSRFPL